MRTEIMNNKVNDELSLEALENVNGGISFKKVIKRAIIASTGVPGMMAYETYKNVKKIRANWNEMTGKSDI